MRMKLWALFTGLLAWAASAAIQMPQIVSHRGESGERPENSMAAFRLAFARGIDGVECDVFATTDGKGVLIHDATTGRTAGSGTNLTVTASTWDELKTVQIGAFGDWIGTEYETETIPLLDDYLGLLASNTTSKCVIELKSSANSLVDVVVAAIQAQPLATSNRVVFISFDTSLISAIRTALPDYPAWLLLYSGTYSGATLVSKIEACHATGIDVAAAATVSAEDIAAVKSAGYTYATWTTDTTAAALALAEKGVDVITTNTGKTLKDDLAAQIADLNNWAEIYDDTAARGATRWDVSSYVQDGLVGHFDGIRNVGADCAHDSRATKWKNLVAGNADATLVLNAASAGSWLANGFDFNGCGYAQVDEPGLTLGTAFTVQLATDYDYTLQPAGSSRWPNVFGFTSVDESSFFYNNNNTSATRTQTLIWKTEPYGESGSTRRPTMVWEGKYITAVLSDKKYFTQTTDLGTEVTRGVTNTIANQRMTWGGSWKEPIKRYSVGTIHAVRLYNRALTEDELVLNRQVDEIRYRGNGVNVVVDSNTAGLEGADGSGFFTVNGTHTFTATNCVKDGLTWAPTGYKLELWDATKESWDILRSETTTSYTHTNCPARAKVRLTWNWRLAAGVKRIDADDYVQAGLLVQFDGLRNAGLAEAHDGTATNWTNLGSFGADAFWTALNTTSPGAWTAKGYDFQGSDYFAFNVPLTLGRQATLQVACDRNDDADGSVNWPHLWGTLDGNEYFNLYVTRNSGLSTYVNRGDCVSFKVDNTTGLGYKTRSYLQPWNGRFLNAVLDYNRSALGETSSLTYKSGTFKADVGRRACSIGTSGSDDSNKLQRMFVGRLYAIRLYDRVLSEAELAHNLELDQVRFQVGAGRSTDTDLVEVTSELADVASDDLGAWLLRGAVEKTFTMTSAVERANATYACAGYRLETWNATKRQWENPQVVANVTTCTLAGTNDAANRRVTWLWTPVRALRTAADYDVGDYVQQGLVAHFDGLRNRGADRPHAVKSMAWRDLSYRGADLQVSDDDVWEDWGANGLVLDPTQQAYARMTETLDLGLENTQQAVLSTTPSAQTVAYPTYLGTSAGDYGCFTRSTGNTLEWKLDAWCCQSSGRPKLTGWNGQYLTTVITPSDMYLTQTASLGTAKTRTVSNSMDDLIWTLGASGFAYDTDDLKKRCVTGTYHAARFYNRALTEAELAQNLKVDEIRYRGAVVTNVVVASELATACGTETNGVYEVLGSWTFTAAPIAVETASGKTRQVNPCYTLERFTDGAWTLPTKHVGGSYTYTAGEDPVRLTWRWPTNLSTIIIVK